MAAYLDVWSMREYVDAQGTRWQRRGTTLGRKQLERRTRRPDVVVLYHYLGAVSEVPPEARAKFWAALHARVAASEHSSFIGAEFKDETGRHLVIIDEGC